MKLEFLRGITITLDHQGEPLTYPPEEPLTYPQGEQLTYVPPSQGPADYQTVGRKLLERDLILPTGEQTAYLVQASYEHGIMEPELEEVKDILCREKTALWVFNKNLWTPDGVYVVHDPDATGLNPDLIKEELDPDATGLNHNLLKDELESMLSNGYESNGIRFSQDGNVRFAPRETYKLGEHTPESLARDGFVIASYGVEGAEALSASAYSKEIYVSGVEVEKGQKLKQKLSALRCPHNYRGHYFIVEGDACGHNRSYSGKGNYMDGYAFGVRKKSISI